MKLQFLEFWMAFCMIVYAAAFFGQPVVYYYWWKRGSKTKTDGGAKWLPSPITIIIFIASALAPIWATNFHATATFEGRNSLRFWALEFARAQEEYRDKHGVYADGPDVFSKLDWHQNNRALQFVWYIGDQAWPPDLAREFGLYPGKDWPFTVQPEMSPKGFTMVAVGNLDNDPTPEVWYVNDRTTDLSNSFWGDLSENLYAPGKTWKFSDELAKKIADARQLQRLRMRWPNQTANVIILTLPVLLILLLIRDELRWRKRGEATKLYRE